VSESILLRFLNANLINVGGDDAKLAKLQETAADLAVALKNEPVKAAPFALIAFDPDAPAEDPVIDEATEALQKRWATFANTFSGRPVAVIRAILLDALVQAARQDDNVGVAFVTSARNALPFMEAGNERTIWGDVVTDIERSIDARAEAEWSTPEKINVPAMKYQPPAAIVLNASELKFDKAALSKRFEAAAGPTNSAGQPTGGNPHWPQNNQHWVSEFGNRLADAVLEQLSIVENGLRVAPIDLSGPLNGLAQAVSIHVDSTLNAVSTATAGLQRRTNLIWWKQTLFSPSARISYRRMSSSRAAALMAFDLHMQVPTFSPASVAAFLQESVASLLDTDKRQTICDLLKEVKTSAELAPLRNAAVELVPESLGRGPLLALIGHDSGRSSIDDKAFRARVGVSAATELNASEWATWIFRELQAARASHESAGARTQGKA
jgi:hypothetical protein